MKKTNKRPLGRPRHTSHSLAKPPTSERILESAAELFCEMGFSATSISAIGERADLTPSAIYAHFDSKADLLFSVVARAIEASPLMELARAKSNPAPDSVEIGEIPRLVSMYVDPERRRLRRLSVEVHAAAVRDKNVADLVAAGNRQVADAYAEHIRSALAEGRSNAHPNSEFIARFLIILTMGLSHLDTLDPGLIGNQAFEDWLKDALAGMLASEGKASP